MSHSSKANLTRRQIALTGLALGLTGVASLAHAQDQDDPQDTLRDRFQQRAQERRQQTNAVREEYAQYAADIRESFAAYREQLAQRWGTAGRLPNKTNLIEYDDERGSRRRVDYESGLAQASVLIEDDADPNAADVRKRLAAEIEGMLAQGPDERGVRAIARDPGRPQRSGPPILEGQVDLGDRPASEFARSVAERRPQVDTVRGGDGITRKIVSVDFNLTPDHIQRRAEQYTDLVNTNAERFSLNTPLVWAIMETESAFQPRAKSAAPAFGLMQLVPTSGARDAYRYVYKRDRLVTDEYLYVPEQNIELGSAYIRLVYDNYLPWIENDRTRLWATVASYNTGSGNVRKAFGRDVATARRTVNELTPDQAFERMRRQLPYQETRDYIVKVRDKSEKYGTV